MATANSSDQRGPGDLLADRTYEALKAAVLTNRLPPGTALSVPELARQLNVSRSPVREAVQRLIYDGLAAYVPHRGAEVSRVEAEDLRQLYAVREVLEGLAARLATAHLDADSMAGLYAVLDEHDRVLSAGADEATHIELDMRFHRRLRELAGNPHLMASLEPIAGRSHFALHSLWRGVDAPRLALTEHRDIVDAMVTGDPDLAEAVARRHIARLRVRLVQAGPRKQDPPGRRRLGKIQLTPLTPG